MFGEKRDWKAICEAATKEQDPEKLMVLIAELMRALDERKAAAKRFSDPEEFNA
jgi:hypothetical protein